MQITLTPKTIKLLKNHYNSYTEESKCFRPFDELDQHLIIQMAELLVNYIVQIECEDGNLFDTHGDDSLNAVINR